MQTLVTTFMGKEIASFSTFTVTVSASVALTAALNTHIPNTALVTWTRLP